MTQEATIPSALLPGIPEGLGEMLPQVIWVTDLHGRVRFVNPYWCLYTGRTERETMANGLLAALRPERAEEIYAAFLASATGAGEREVEFELRRSDGAYRWFLAKGMPLRHEDGYLVGWTGVGVEIHERRLARELACQREAELRHELEASRAASAAKDRFLAKLSHELRTPLNPALMTVELLRENPSLDAEAQEDLLMLRRNLLTETRLIDDLLDLTRIINGKLVMRRTRCDLAQIARDAVRVCQPAIAARGMRIVDGLGAGPLPVHGDSTRLEQVVWNLVSNAIKFSPDGGVIALHSEIRGPSVRLTVRDEGRGLDEASIPLLFAPFEQGSEDVTRRYGGLGLGLSICKAIVEIHGGHIGAASQGEGLGAEFYFDLSIIN